jgi:hypothetical protein
LHPVEDTVLIGMVLIGFGGAGCHGVLFDSGSRGLGGVVTREHTMLLDSGLRGLGWLVTFTHTAGMC